jgi:hypothetical protein
MDQQDSCFRWRVYEPEGQIQEGTWGASLAGETLDRIEDLTCNITGRPARRMYQPGAYSEYSQSELIMLGVNYRFSPHAFEWDGRLYRPTILQSTFMALGDDDKQRFIAEVLGEQECTFGSYNSKFVFGEVWQKLHMV